jgi:hypothetical protein
LFFFQADILGYEMLRWRIDAMNREHCKTVHLLPGWKQDEVHKTLVKKKEELWPCMYSDASHAKDDEFDEDEGILGPLFGFGRAVIASIRVQV